MIWGLSLKFGFVYGSGLVVFMGSLGFRVLGLLRLIPKPDVIPKPASLHPAGFCSLNAVSAGRLWAKGGYKWQCPKDGGTVQRD